MRRKRACLVRHAAAGDCIQSSALIPYVLQDGYEIDFYTSKIGMEILANDPRINLVRFPDNVFAGHELDGFYQSQLKDYDAGYVLTGSVEGKFLHAYPNEEWYWPLGKRRKRCSNKSYILDMIESCGYEPVPEWQTGKLYFSPEDIAFAKNFRAKYKDKFIILFALSGSSTHKVYIYYHQLCQMILKEIPEALIVACGSFQDMMLSFEHPRIVNLGFFNFSIMRSFALCQIADLVMGPETALLNAAGCFDVPKICLLSHSSRENLTSTWKNDYSLQARCYCSPCHRLHKVSRIWRNWCPLDKVYHAKYRAEIPACAGEGFPPRVLLGQIMKIQSLR